MALGLQALLSDERQCSVAGLRFRVCNDDQAVHATLQSAAARGRARLDMGANLRP